MCIYVYIYIYITCHIDRSLAAPARRRHPGRADAEARRLSGLGSVHVMNITIIQALFLSLYLSLTLSMLYIYIYIYIHTSLSSTLH